eukprot:COSAG01_NODE_59777_length_298_cov_0.874372_1_plen_28_part_01
MMRAHASYSRIAARIAAGRAHELPGLQT